MPDPLSQPSVPGVDHADIELGDVVLRRWRADHAEAFHRTVADNLDHLRPWMPWIAAEPVALAERRVLLQRWESEWDAGGDRHWGIFDGGRPIGSIGLMARVGVGALEMGYWLERASTGRGIVTRAARALTTVALGDPGIERVEIHHDRANVASGAVPRRLGYRLTEQRPDEITAPGESGVSCVWSMTAAEWGAGAPSADGPGVPPIGP
jgi:RimJ/RimL family protein N-acetyltransferase